MSDKSFRLQILTPERAVLDKQVDYVLLRASDGEIGVLKSHENSIVPLAAGFLKAYEDKIQTDIYAVAGGFASVTGDGVVVMTPMAEPPDQFEAALAAKERARSDNKRLEQASDLDMHRAENALRRMLVDMDISSYSIIGGKNELDDGDA